MSDKSIKGIVLTTLLLLLILTVFVVPAGAQPPNQVITFDSLVITYSQGNFTSVSGNWSSSEGLFEGTGSVVQTARHSGWPGNGWQFKNAHFSTTISNDIGTVTIQDQTTDITWDGFDATASGRWVIMDATGAYEGLHGVGTSTLEESKFHFVCPDPNVEGVCIINKTTLNGQGYFDPS